MCWLTPTGEPPHNQRRRSGKIFSTIAPCATIESRLNHRKSSYLSGLFCFESGGQITKPVTAQRWDVSKVLSGSVMAIILIFLNFFSFGQNLEDGLTASILPDSTRKAQKRHVVRRDSTGRFVLINRVLIVGNRLTRDQIIIRELSLKPGDLIYDLDLPEVLDLDSSTPASSTPSISARWSSTKTRSISSST